MFLNAHLARAIASLFCTAAIIVTPVAVPAQSGSQGASAPSAKEKAAPAVVNINTANAAELQTLPGVGAATAARILEYRQKNGGFKKVEDIMNVRGIGEKTFLKLKPLITITPPKAVSL